MFSRIASTGGRACCDLMNKRGLASTRGVSQFDVGGHKFTIQSIDLGKFSSSKLYQMTLTGKKEVKISRSGILFQHVKNFLHFGQLPRGTEGKVMMDDQILAELGKEAQFYGLHDLSAECNSVPQNTRLDFQSYFAIREYVADVLCDHKNRWHRSRALKEYLIIPMPSLTHALKCLWVPYCAAGNLFWYKEKFDLLMSDLGVSPNSSLSPDANEGTIDVTMLDATAIDKIIAKLRTGNTYKQFAPHLELTLLPRELEIEHEGSVQQQKQQQKQSRVLKSSRHTGHIGTLVVILNSTYTGGELEVTHNGHTEVVTGPYNWVAMYGDCLHKINPVTSGTRATLVFDIYGKKRGASEEDNKTCFEKHFSNQSAPPERPGLVNTLHHPSAMQKREILKCFKAEMKHRDSIVVGLHHQYHYNTSCQVPTLERLRGGDKVLYEFLLSSGEYDIKLLSFTVQQVDHDRPTVKLFSHDVVRHFHTNYPTEMETTEPQTRTAVVMPSFINEGWILSVDSHQDHFDDTIIESVYLVSGLQISKKVTN